MTTFEPRPPLVAEVTGREISVGVDSSEAGDAALRWALHEAVLRLASVHAVSVFAYGSSAAYGTGWPLANDRKVEPGRRAEAEAALVRVGYDGAVPVRIDLRSGRPGSALNAGADASQAELVVIGRATGDPTHELVFGSTSRMVRGNGVRPIVVVPPSVDGVERRPFRSNSVIAVGVDGSLRARAALA